MFNMNHPCTENLAELITELIDFRIKWVNIFHFWVNYFFNDISWNVEYLEMFIKGIIRPNICWNGIHLQAIQDEDEFVS